MPTMSMLASHRLDSFAGKPFFVSSSYCEKRKAIGEGEREKEGNKESEEWGGNDS